MKARVWASRLLCAVAVVLPMPAGAVTLTEAMIQAYQQNPTLDAQRAFVRSVDENVPLALSGWRPVVTVTGAAGAQHVRLRNRPDASDNPIDARLSIEQPLYRGGRTVAATQQAEKQVEAARQGLRAVEQQVLLDVVTSYMNVLRDQARLQLTTNNEAVLRRQLEAARDRFEVGEVTRTDVAQAEARLAGAISGRTTAAGDLEQSRAAFLRVVGMRPVDLQPAPPLPPLPKTLEEAIEIAVRQNPTLEQARLTEQAQGYAVRVATGNLLPTVSVVGEVTRSSAVDDDPISSTAGSEALLAQVTVPLYQSGAVSAQIRQAKHTRNQRRIEIEETRRAVEQQVIQAWETLMAARQVIVSRREQVTANQIALDGVIQEHAVGARTTLDVLDAEQELLDSQVALVIAERDEYVAGYALLAAIGSLTVEALGLDVTPYDPAQHYQRVRDKWWGWQIEDDDGGR